MGVGEQFIPVVGGAQTGARFIAMLAHTSSGVPFAGTGLVLAPPAVPQGPGHPGPAENLKGGASESISIHFSFFIYSLWILVQAPSGSLGGGSHDSLS